MKLSKNSARHLALQGLGLDGQRSAPGCTEPAAGLPSGKEGVARTIERLGYVQIDTIAVVERAHHHVLWTRRPDYDAQMLHELLAHDRRVFEGWTHATSIIPMRDYRYYLPKMRASRARAEPWLNEHHAVVDRVLDRIRDEGPLGSADFKGLDSFERGTWWSWKPAKRALEALLSMGELMVAERRNFERLYDLRERVLPEWVDTTEPTGDEVARFLVRWILRVQGVASRHEIWHKRASRDLIDQVLVELLDAGEIVRVEVEGWSGDPCYVLSEVLEEDHRVIEDPPSLHILSPFDSLIIYREWLEKVFDFRYRIECYLPVAKREYGYFALPILWADRFVGRVDAKADRDAGTLILRRLTFEPGVSDYDVLLPVLEEKLRDFAAFNGCDSIVVERVVPEKVKGETVNQLTG
ncbi:MAG: winged helix-turn-helix domain-containing protein [Anaerolineae bacterium]